MKKPLTEIQQKCYDYIVWYLKKYRWPPSVKEIADGLFYTEGSSVSRHLRNLEKLGWIERGNKPRQLRLSKGERRYKI